MSTPAPNTSIELTVQADHNRDEASGPNDEAPSPGEGVVQQLKPVDGGLAAWRLLLAAFVFEALLWGFPISFGVFQNYYSTLPQFKESPNIALIGTIAQGLCYMGSPLSCALTRRYPKYQRLQIYIAWPICILGLVTASFATTIGGLIATQGVMYGVGFITLTYPILSFIDEWWVARKGMAFGMISSASGASGAVMPFVIEAMLNKYGYKTTLRATALVMAVLTVPFLPILKGRLLPAENSTRSRMNWSFVKKPLFYIYGMATLAQGLRFFFPAVYLPSYATAIGLSATQGALLLSIMAISQLVGQFAFGYLTDKKVSVSLLAVCCSLVAAIALLALWGMAKSLGVLLVFGILYGFFGYGFGAMRAGMGRAVSDDPSAAVTTYAILVFLQGVGNILVGPLSDVLLGKRVSVGVYGIERYRSLIVFAGSCLFASAAIIGLWSARPRNMVQVIRQLHLRASSMYRQETAMNANAVNLV